MKTYILHSSEEAATAADALIDASSPFSLEPWPEDEWRLTLKEEVRHRVETRLGRELLPATA